MDQILLCSNHIPLTTSITNSFIRNYMLDANGSYVKVYLYLSMCIQSGERNLSLSSLADMMENTEKDILRALAYWEKKGLILLQKRADDIITGIELINPDELSHTVSTENSDRNFSDNSVDTASSGSTETISDDSSVEAAYPEIFAKNSDNPVTETFPAVSTDTLSATKDDSTSVSTHVPDFSVTEEQTTRLALDETFSWICLIVESYLGHPLKTAEIQLLAYLFDTLKFSKDLILHLYEYCCSLKKTNVNYVQAVAISWAENNITTPEQAQEHSINYNASHTAISKALGLGRSLAKIECEYIERWHNQWKMDLSVIIEACNRTMLAIQKPDFKYIDGILSNWHQKNVHTLQDIRICDEAHKRHKNEAARKPASAAAAQSQSKRTQFQAFQQRDTSKEEIDQLEKLLLTR